MNQFNSDLNEMEQEKSELRQRKRLKYSYSVMCFKKIDARTLEEKVSVLKITIVDISYGGIGITCDKKLELGDILIFNMVVQDLHRLEFNAQVKWQKYEQGSYKVGLEFVELSKEKVLLLHDIIKLIKKGRMTNQPRVL